MCELPHEFSKKCIEFEEKIGGDEKKGKEEIRRRRKTSLRRTITNFRVIKD